MCVCVFTISLQKSVIKENFLIAPSVKWHFQMYLPFLPTVRGIQEINLKNFSQQKSSNVESLQKPQARKKVF
jgi:hypothetical protein